MMAYIKYISYYLPDKIITNEDLVRDFPEWTVDKIAGKIGVKERHVAASDETAGDMAEAASRLMFREYGVQASDIDFIILCTQSPDYLLPTTSCILQDRLGIPKSAGAIDFNLGCSGYVYGLAIAKGLIQARIAKNILLITSETYSKHIHSKDKGNRTIFGDAAAASLISSEGFAEIQNFSLGTDGSGANNLIIKSGGLRNPVKINDLTYDEENNPICSDNLYMNGPEIFTYTIETVPPLIQDTLEKNGLTQDQIDLFVFHQANQYMLNYLRKKIKIEEEKFYYFLEKVGNTVSSTIPIALKEAMKDNKLKGYVLLAGFGVGYSSGGTILKISD